jgi:hypothetical protein
MRGGVVRMETSREIKCIGADPSLLRGCSPAAAEL